MLDPERIDLVDLAVALEDHSSEHTWWLDPVTGELSLGFEGPLDVGDGRLLRVQPLPTSVGYTDMEEFVAQLRDRTARRVLRAAITGRERVEGRGKELYVDFIDGIGESMLDRDWKKTKKAPVGTARNWNTVLKLAAMVGL